MDPGEGPLQEPLIAGSAHDDQGEEVVGADGPPHLHRLPGEETMWESSTPFYLLSLGSLCDFWNLGEDIIVVTSMRVILCQVRSTPIIGLLSCWKPRYSSAILRRRDVSTIAVRRIARWPITLKVTGVVWFVVSAYLLSWRFLGPEEDRPPDWVGTIFVPVGVGVAALIWLWMFVSVDWVVSISHRSSKNHRSSMTARVANPTAVGDLEDAIRAGFTGGGGRIFDIKKTNKGDKDYVEGQPIDLNLITIPGARTSSHVRKTVLQQSRLRPPSPNPLEAPALDDDTSSLPSGDPPDFATLPSDPEEVPGIPLTTVRSATEGQHPHEEQINVHDDSPDVPLDAHPVHKHLMPGERLLYRCKHTVRLLLCIPVGDNYIAVTTKRLIIKKSRIPPILPRYSFVSVLREDVRTIQHVYMRLFGMERVVYTTVLFWLAVLFLWFYLNDYYGRGSRFYIWWLYKPPELLLQMPWYAACAIPAFFLVLLIFFHFSRSWGIIFDIIPISHLNIGSLRVALSGARQMNAIEDALRTAVTPVEDDRPPDEHRIPDYESPVGEAVTADAEVVVTTKRLLVCRGQKGASCWRRWVSFWFSDYHVGSYAVQDVVACNTKWLAVIGTVAMLLALWIGLWGVAIGLLFRFYACDEVITLSCSDKISLGIQVGAVLVLLFTFYALLQRTPGLAFSIYGARSFKFHRRDLLEVRMTTGTMNMIQEWLKGVQSAQGSYLPDHEEAVLGHRNNKYARLTVLTSDTVRLNGPFLPPVGAKVSLQGAGKWSVVKAAKGGGVRVTSCEGPNAALAFGDLGDDCGPGEWTELTPTPEQSPAEKRKEQAATELEAREKAALERAAAAEQAVEAYKNHVAALDKQLTGMRGDADELRAALRDQTMQLIQTRGELVTVEKDKEEMSRAHQQSQMEGGKQGALVTVLERQLEETRRRLLEEKSRKRGPSFASPPARVVTPPLPTLQGPISLPPTPAPEEIEIESLPDDEPPWEVSTTFSHRHSAW